MGQTFQIIDALGFAERGHDDVYNRRHAHQGQAQQRQGDRAAPGLAWSAERADDWRTPPADHVTTRYEEKQLGDIAPVFLDFVRG